MAADDIGTMPGAWAGEGPATEMHLRNVMPPLDDGALHEATARVATAAGRDMRAYNKVRATEHLRTFEIEFRGDQPNRTVEAYRYDLDSRGVTFYRDEYDDNSFDYNRILVAFVPFDMLLMVREVPGAKGVERGL